MTAAHTPTHSPTTGLETAMRTLRRALITAAILAGVTFGLTPATASAAAARPVSVSDQLGAYVAAHPPGSTVGSGQCVALVNGYLDAVFGFDTAGQGVAYASDMAAGRSGAHVFSGRGWSWSTDSNSGDFHDGDVLVWSYSAGSSAGHTAIWFQGGLYEQNAHSPGLTISRDPWSWMSRATYAGRWIPPGGGMPSDGDFVSYQGNVYRLAGGAPLYVPTWAIYGGPRPTTPLSDAQWASLRLYPADGTFVSSAASGEVFRFAGGAPIYVGSWSVYGGPQPTVGISDDDIANADGAAPWNHVRRYPADGTFVSAAPSGEVFRFAGGAPIYVGSWSVYGGAQPTVGISDDDIANADGAPPWNHVRRYPADGTFVSAAPSGRVFVVGAGVPTYVSTWASVGGPKPTVGISDDDITNAGQASPWNHLRPAVRIVTSTLPGARRGRSYHFRLAAMQGNTPYRWTAAHLPRGLALTSSGALSGVPKATGTYTVVVRVVDSRNARDTAAKTLRLVVHSK